MNIPPSDSKKRLLYILHLGFVEVRNLALASGDEQIADLADALELLPRFVEECSADDWEMARFVLRTYQEKHNSRYDFPARLEQYEPPERY